MHKPLYLIREKKSYHHIHCLMWNTYNSSKCADGHICTDRPTFKGSCSSYSLFLHWSRQVLAHHRPPPGPHLPPGPRPHQGLLLFQRSPRHPRWPIWGLPVWLSLPPHPVSLHSHGTAHTATGLHHMDRVSTPMTERWMLSYDCLFLLLADIEKLGLNTEYFCWIKPKSSLLKQ